MIPDVRDTFDRIPKVELHCHVEGTVRSATVLTWRARPDGPCRSRTLGCCIATTRSTRSSTSSG